MALIVLLLLSEDYMAWEWGPFRVEVFTRVPVDELILERVRIVEKATDSVLFDSFDYESYRYMFLDTVMIAELDGDGEEELLLVMMSLGVRCCHENTIFDRDNGMLYRAPLIISEGFRPKLEDVDGDGDMEIVFWDSFLSYIYKAITYPYVVLDYHGDIHTWECSFPMTGDYNMSHLIDIEEGKECVECCVTNAIRLVYAGEEELERGIFLRCMQSYEGFFGETPDDIWDEVMWYAMNSPHYNCLRGNRYWRWYFRVFGRMHYDLR